MTQDTKQTIQEIIGMEPRIEAIAINGEFEDKNARLVVIVKEGINPMDCYYVPSTYILDKYNLWDDESDNNLVIVLDNKCIDPPSCVAKCKLVYRKGEWLKDGISMSAY